MRFKYVTRFLGADAFAGTLVSCCLLPSKGSTSAACHHVPGGEQDVVRQRVGRQRRHGRGEAHHCE